jgi:hypothetical protein
MSTTAAGSMSTRAPIVLRYLALAAAVRYGALGRNVRAANGNRDAMVVAKVLYYDIS